ncbi:MAG: Sec-independent protein translocase protein TatB [Thiobacillaceae bacterium]
MFDIGFSELILIGVVALIVIGPERLPKVARTAGLLFGRFQRYASRVKEDISREMELDELRQAGQTFKESVESAARGVEHKASEAEHTMRNEPLANDKALEVMGLAETPVSESTAALGQGDPAVHPAPVPADLAQPTAIVHSEAASAKPADSDKEA